MTHSHSLFVLYPYKNSFKVPILHVLSLSFFPEKRKPTAPNLILRKAGLKPSYYLLGLICLVYLFYSVYEPYNT